uniref:3-hydroxyisobutyrate dehydrogenase n=1 Tax=Cacopsylla melanoneura TaxID=428564 RepID=A0A8D8Y2S6_9HEMI
MLQGHDVIVYDKDTESSKSLAQEGANMALSLSSLASGADFIISMLPANEHVLDTYSGTDGILNHCKEGTILIDSSTVDPQVPQTLAELAIKKHNVKFLDAPVSGGTKAAQEASLTFMVGGDKEALDKADPILKCMGRNVVYCGPTGNGQIAKLCNNMLLGVSMMGVAEAMNLGIKLGMDAKLLSQVINSSSGRCWSSEVYNPVPDVLPNVPSSNNYNGGFKISLLAKDMKLAEKLSERALAQTDLAKLAINQYEHLIGKGFQDKDFSYIYEYLKNKA